MPRGHRKRNKIKPFLNSTPWNDAFLRKMLTWVCREFEVPRKYIKQVEFGNRTNTTWSGWCNHLGGKSFSILVRIGPESHFPTNTKTYRDGFSVGRIEDRIEALVKVTAHEVAHASNCLNKNKSRGRGGWGGSERYTDGRTKVVLDKFRENRDELLKAWEPPKKAASKKKSPVEKRAENAFKKLEEWERKLKLAKTKLKYWKKKAKYYRDKYPGGEYPDPADRKARKKPTLKPETILKRKISKYITNEIEDNYARSMEVEVKYFSDVDSLTRPDEPDAWGGDFATMREARAMAKLGDTLECYARCRRTEEFSHDFDICIPETEEELDKALK